MRSRIDYIVTKEEVHGYANYWLEKALKFEYEGRRYDAGTLYQILLIAAARVVSIFAACRDLADAPSDQTIRNMLAVNLPAEIAELEKRLNSALIDKLPKAFHRKKRMIAMDLTLIPYHGQPLNDEKEIYRGSPKSGTTHFHAYATAAVVHNGHRYTLALTHVEKGESMKEVVQRLIARLRKRGVKIKFILLDKGFFSVDVISYLKRARYGFIMPAVVRGRKPKPPKKHTGLRALLRKKHGYYSHTLVSDASGQRRSVKLTICVASKSYTHEKTNKKKRKKLLYAIHKVRRTPKEIRELYRKRFGIETSYRQMQQAKIATSTRDPRHRLLFVAVALVLRNVWVWLHFKLAKNKWSAEPQLFLELLRFKEMLLWITQIVQQLLGADQMRGIDLETYTRATARE